MEVSSGVDPRGPKLTEREGEGALHSKEKAELPQANR